MRRILIFLGVIAAFGVLSLGNSSCDTEKPSSEKQRQNSVEDRASNFAAAQAKYPQPRQQNFPMREALVKYTQRQDLINHPWYIYVANQCYQCQSGLSYQYFIGQTYPQSTCNFLGSTEEVRTVSRGDTGVGVVTLTAPSLDGIYYGGGGSQGGGCDYFFFDQATDAMMVLHHDWIWFVSDRLLLLDARQVQTR